MLIKLLRTIIGLPFVLAAWLLVIAFAILAVIFESIIWSFTGNFSQNEIDDLRRAMGLPYYFIRAVWKGRG
jgi:hypothetical protein